MKRTPLLAIAFAVAALPLAAQIQFGLDSLASKATETTGVSLPAPMLQLASGFLAKDKSVNPEIQKLIAGLKNITVKKFTFAEEGQYKPEDLQPIRDQLRTAGWTTFIDRHEKDEVTDIYTKSEGGQIGGIAVVKTEPKEVKVIYIEGVIDLVGLANLAGQFGIPPLGLPAPSSDSAKGKVVQ